MKKIFVFLFIILLVSASCLTTNNAAREAGAGQTEIIVHRPQMPINSGFKSRIYINGRQQLVLGNGETGKIIVQNGNHTIHADLYTMTSGKVQFSAESQPITFIVTPYSTQDLAMELNDGSFVPPAVVTTPNRNTPQTSQSQNSGGSRNPFSGLFQGREQSQPQGQAQSSGSVEGSLVRASGHIIERVPQNSRIAIVYVTAQDSDVAEYIAEELEYIMVGKGLLLIDRSQLDRIRREQLFQLSGEVDDSQAVSVGRIAGANVIITGAVTGAGELRRLRLRLLDTQTGQVLAAASERY